MIDIFKEYMHRLTGAFNTEYGQNLQKVVRFFAWSLSDVRDEFNGIAAYRSIDKASGKLLDTHCQLDQNICSPCFLFLFYGFGFFA